MRKLQRTFLVRNVLLAAGLAGLGAVTLPAYAAVVVVVSAKSGAATLTTEQAAQLFTGKVSSIPGGGAHAALLDQAEDSPARDQFYTKVTGKNASQMKALWSRLTFSGTAQPPKVVGGDADVKKALAADPDAIGYIEKSAVDGTVKVLLTTD